MSPHLSYRLFSRFAECYVRYIFTICPTKYIQNLVFEKLIVHPDLKLYNFTYLVMLINNINCNTIIRVVIS